MPNLNLVTELYSTFQSLQEANARVRNLILSSSGDIYLPHTFKVVGDARLCVANALTELWFYSADNDRMHGDAIAVNVPYSGLLCASAELITAAHSLNVAKAAFKQCVVALRDEDKQKNIKFQFVGYMKNDSHYQEAMRRAGIGGLNLMACYRQVKVLDEDLKAVRWVWQIKPKSIEKKKVQDLLDSLDSNAYAGKNDIREMLKRILSGLKPTDYVAEIKAKSPKLRANLTYLAEGADPSSAVRKSIACSGILLTPSDRLPPNIAWKDRPDDKTKGRWTTSSTIEAEPFVPATKLHFYREGCMPSDLPKGVN
jgi:hypothetical protein